MFTWILTSVLLMLNLCLWIGNICNGLLLGNASIARGLTCCKKLARHEASRKSWSTKFPLGGEVNHIWPLAYLWHGLVGHEVKVSMTYILSCILKTIWCLYIILWDYKSVWPDVWPKNKCRSLWPIFSWSSDYTYILKTIWCMTPYLGLWISMTRRLTSK